MFDIIDQTGRLLGKVAGQVAARYGVPSELRPVVIPMLSEAPALAVADPAATVNHQLVRFRWVSVRHEASEGAHVQLWFLMADGQLPESLWRCDGFLRLDGLFDPVPTAQDYGANVVPLKRPRQVRDILHMAGDEGGGP